MEINDYEKVTTGDLLQRLWENTAAPVTCNDSRKILNVLIRRYPEGASKPQEPTRIPADKEAELIAMHTQIWELWLRVMNLEKRSDSFKEEVRSRLEVTEKHMHDHDGKHVLRVLRWF